MKKRLFPLVLALVFGLCLTSYAHEVPDLTKNGTITLEVHWEDTPLDGGELAMYRVGDITENNGDYGFTLVPELAGSGVSLENTDDPALALQLAELVENAGLEPMTASVEDGLVIFEDVAPSLYIMIQTEACEGFAKMSPFLISMPRYEEGVYVTDVVAKPKVPVETAPSEPSEPTEPTIPTIPSLPDTGQLNWPVPLLAAAGLAFFALGWVLCYRTKRESNET